MDKQIDDATAQHWYDTGFQAGVASGAEHIARLVSALTVLTESGFGSVANEYARAVLDELPPELRGK